jgi:hypothetical protein
MLQSWLVLLFLPVLIYSSPVQEITVDESNILHEAAKNGKIDILIKYVDEEKAENPNAKPGILTVPMSICLSVNLFLFRCFCPLKHSFDRHVGKLKRPRQKHLHDRLGINVLIMYNFDLRVVNF